MVENYTSVFTVYESPLVLISIRESAYTSLPLYEALLHRCHISREIIVNYILKLFLKIIFCAIRILKDNFFVRSFVKTL
jgi:hypothetical protein